MPFEFIEYLYFIYPRPKDTRERKKKSKKKDVEEEEKTIKRGVLAQSITKYESEKIREEVEVEVVKTEEKGGN